VGDFFLESFGGPRCVVYRCWGALCRRLEIWR